jgi:hypothetical protein
MRDVDTHSFDVWDLAQDAHHAFGDHQGGSVDILD